MRLPFLSVSVCAITLGACGSDNNFSGTAGAIASPGTDSHAAVLSISGQLDDIIYATIRGDVAGLNAADFKLTGNNESEKEEKEKDKNESSDEKKSRKQLCTENKAGGTTTVQSAFSGFQTLLSKQGERSLTLGIFGTGAQTFNWRKDGTELKCDCGNIQIDANSQQLDGLELEWSFTRDKSKSFSFLEAQERSGRMVKTVAHNVKGNRSVLWLPGATQLTENHQSDEKISYLRGITSSAELSLVADDVGGKKVVLPLKFVTEPGAMLKVATVRSKSDLTLLSHTVESGRTVATHIDGTDMNMTFEKVKFTREGKCMPESGKITGIVKALGTEAGISNFTIDFAKKPVKVHFDNETSQLLMLEGCDWEDDIH